MRDDELGVGKGIYLDNNATTRIDPKVVEAMMPYFNTYYGNPSSQHGFGLAVDRAINHAREQVADLLGAAHPDEIIFTSCATESDNTAVWTSLFTQKDKNEIVTTKLEHPAILDTCSFLSGRGVEVKYLGANSLGDIDPAEFEKLLSPKTALASIMWANNETGNIYPVPQMAEIAAAHNVVFHTDAVQAVGKIPINLKDTKINMLSFSGHKLHAPKGIGALYVRRGTRFIPFMHGGHQERGRRAGTENVPYIIGMGEAARLAAENMEAERRDVARLRDRLESGLLKAVPDCMVNGDVENRLPNTSNIAFKNVEGEAILLMLDRLGICASSGSACTSGSLEPSHVLRAMGVPFNYAHGSVRLSLSRYTTEEEVDFVIAHMPDVIKTLRALSPFKD